MSATKDQIAALYIAVFNRAPDWAGLQYWLDVDDFAAMAKGFVVHPVFRAAYGDLSHADFVQAIYENVLNGQADTAGLAFWTQALESGLNRGEFLAQFLDAALTYQGTEADALLRQQALFNKMKVALSYTELMAERSNLLADTDPSSLAVTADPVYQQSQAVLATVTAEPATVVAALASIEVLAGAGGVVAVLEHYHAAVGAHDAAWSAEQTAANALVVAGLSTQRPDAQTKWVDVAAVRHEAEAVVEDLAGLALAAADVPSALSLNDQTLAWVRQSFASETHLQQQQVSLLKQQHYAAVTLQQKIQAYNDFLEAVEQSHVNLQVAEQRLSLNNTGLSFSGPEVGLSAGNRTNYHDQFQFALGLDTDTVAGVVRLRVEDGRLLVTAKANSWGELSQSQANLFLQNQFHTLAGVGELKAAVLAVYQNYAAQAQAAQAVDAAALAALKAAGYTVYQASGKKGSWADIAIINGVLGAAPDSKQAVVPDALAGVELRSPVAAHTPITTNQVLVTGLVAEHAGERVELFDNGIQHANSALQRGETWPAAIEAAAAYSEQAVLKASQAQKNSQAFEAAWAHYQAATELLQTLHQASAQVAKTAEAVTQAQALFEELAVNVVLPTEGVAWGELDTPTAIDPKPDLFLYSPALSVIEYFDAPQDSVYFGNHAFTLVQLDEGFDPTTDRLGGDSQTREIFAVQHGADTVLYIEHEPFAGNSSNSLPQNVAVATILLTGVQSTELMFTEGFLTTL